ncbi:DUF4249 domain-containing protein [Mucilaginibacter daejeonensis]|uniref:DUF4249 domain-containing protein n=1 Tax=Mucilaginibacter daejeonensis TaxID=398049 RepID=UPI001D17579D|nr:DUF4249 domain-containing protein [Mucilaginibacter daejeonensis]UEG52113.1 DUF4249 domain-containing protein [Mucilaginibacter daejeonensis]
MSIIYSVMLISACSKDTGISVDTQPVIEGYLIPGHPISVKVYEQKGTADTATYGPLISGLRLQVSDGANIRTLTETAKGTYTHADDNFLIAGKTYKLSFTYNELAVSASTLMPQKPNGYTATRTTINLPYTTGMGGGNPVTGTDDSVAVTFKWNNTDSLYHVLTFINDESDPAKANLISNRPVNFTQNVRQADHYDMYYRSFNYLGTYRAILYRVNKEYTDILTTNTSTTSQKLTNPPTNVVNGFGIFTAMRPDTITLHLTQY